jgi:hypothetical protein
MTAVAKPIIDQSNILLRLKNAEILKDNRITFYNEIKGEATYSIFFIPSESAPWSFIDSLRDKYYIVHGYGFGGKGFGYTVVFNQERKGVFKKYPHQHGTC